MVSNDCKAALTFLQQMIIDSTPEEFPPTFHSEIESIFMKISLRAQR